jgi:hypothetical protein
MKINKVKFLKAQSLFEQRQYAAAIRKIKNRSSLDEELFYSKLLVMQNKPNEALAHLDRLATVYKKDKTDILLLQAAILQTLGKQDEANKLSIKMILLQKCPVGYLNHLQSGYDSIPLLDASMIKILESKYESSYIRGIAAYCLFNVGLDSTKYEYLHSGAKFIRSTIKYNHQANIKNLKSITNYFPVKPNGQLINHRDKGPIFIVGMPRSGTTLLEQMLGTHPGTLAVGESVNIGRLFYKHGLDSKGNIDVSKIDFHKVGSEYLKLTYGQDSNKFVLVDKMPNNFIYVGFILALFPNAKIIYSKRNAMDNCYSIYKAVFQKNRHKYSYSQSELADYYKAHEYLMKSWVQKFPKNVHTVEYENLVTDTEIELRSLLQFCNLEWNQECLSFHKNEAVVQTLSAHQVKKPVHKDSIGRGLRILPHFTQLADMLSKTNA